MTDDERRKLDECHAWSREMYQAFMEPTPAGEPPLIKRMAGVVIVVERSNWAARWLIKGFLTIGGIAGALAAILALRGGK